MNETRKLKIAFCLVNNMLTSSVTWPSEIWLAAEAFAKKSKSPHDIKLSISTVDDSENTNSYVNTHSILEIKADKSIFDDEIYDLIYIPALWRNPQRSILTHQKLITWLETQYNKGSAICGTGTGCCFIAETGLLDNKPATTHWYYFDTFKKKYPNVILKRDHFITEADTLFCAASINSLADLTIKHIENYYGKSVAQHIQRHFSHEMRSPYEQLAYSNTSYLNHEDESILHIQLWLHENYDKNISIKELAKNNNMSERTLARRFHQSSQSSPTEYLQRIRIEKGKELIGQSNLSISEIAELIGFYDASHFAKIFKKYNDLSPNGYRKMVRRKLFQQ